MKDRLDTFVEALRNELAILQGQESGATSAICGMLAKAVETARMAVEAVDERRHDQWLERHGFGATDHGKAIGEALARASERARDNEKVFADVIGETIYGVPKQQRDEIKSALLKDGVTVTTVAVDADHAGPPVGVDMPLSQAEIEKFKAKTVGVGYRMTADEVRRYFGEEQNCKPLRGSHPVIDAIRSLLPWKSRSPH